MDKETHIGILTDIITIIQRLNNKNKKIRVKGKYEIIKKTDKQSIYP